MRLAAIRTLGVGLTLFATGGVLRSVRMLAHDIDAEAVATWNVGALVAFVSAWIATLLLRRPQVFQRVVIVLAVALLIVPAISQSWDGDAPPPLTSREREAFEYLRRADMLEMQYVGFSAVYSGGFLAMRIVGRSLAADEAFKELVRTGTLAGQLYGLCGARRTDPLVFRLQVLRFAASEEEVPVFSGCVISNERVDHLVRAPGAIQLRRHESLIAWWNAHPRRDEPFIADIDGGGYSSMFFDRGDHEAEVFAAERAYDFTP